MPHAPSQATDSSRPTWPHLADESDILNESGSLPPPPAQMQQQQTQQRLGRGQLFHCWRRKPGQPYTMAAPDGASPPAHDTGASALPSASYTIGELSCQEAETLYEESNAAAWGSDESQKSSDKSRRASFHMGQDEQPISETIPLHGPGRPHSSRPHPDPHSNVYSDAEDRPISTGRDASGSTAFSRETLKPSGSEASSNSHLPHQDDHAPSLHTSARSGAEGSALSEPALPETCHSLGQSSESMRLQGAAAPHGQPQRVGQPGRADSPTGPHVPLFVPIVLILEQRDHEVLLREAASRNLVGSHCLTPPPSPPPPPPPHPSTTTHTQTAIMLKAICRRRAHCQPLAQFKGLHIADATGFAMPQHWLEVALHTSFLGHSCITVDGQV